MDEFSEFPSLTHMVLLLGPRTEHEIDAALARIGEFDGQRDEYRRRISESGIALRQDEAVEAYNLVAPLCVSNLDPEFADLCAITSMICFPCKETGMFGFLEPAIKAILDGFEREIVEGGSEFLINYEGEDAPRQVDKWSRYVAYRALEHFVECHSLSGVDPADELPHAVERAQTVLANRTVNRPRGPYDPRQYVARDTFIWICLKELEDCGLPVTAREARPSLANALARATSISAAIIAKAWRDAPFRIGRHSRQLFVPCANCGELIRKIEAGLDYESGRVEPLCKSCSGSTVIQ